MYMQSLNSTCMHMLVVTQKETNPETLLESSPLTTVQLAPLLVQTPHCQSPSVWHVLVLPETAKHGQRREGERKNNYCRDESVNHMTTHTVWEVHCTCTCTEGPVVLNTYTGTYVRNYPFCMYMYTYCTSTYIQYLLDLCPVPFRPLLHIVLHAGISLSPWKDCSPHILFWCCQLRKG